MYFDKCTSIEEMVIKRDELFTAINDEYRNRVSQLSEVKKSETNSFIFQVEELKGKPEIFMAFPINSTRGKKNEIIFHANGTVTL